MTRDSFVRQVTWIFQVVFAQTPLYHQHQDSPVKVLLIALQTMLMQMGNASAHLMRSIQVTVTYLKGTLHGDKSFKTSRHIGMRLKIYVILLRDGMSAEAKALNTINGNVPTIKLKTMWTYFINKMQTTQTH